MLRGRKGVLPENVTHEVERIGASTRSLVSLVNDFLDLARLQGTNYEIEHDPVDISGVIGSTVDELAAARREPREPDLRSSDGRHHRDG